VVEAVNNPLLEIEPSEVMPQLVSAPPEVVAGWQTDHATAEFELPVTVDVN
jgi:hypothetical protein